MAGAVSPQKPEIRCGAELKHGSKAGRKCGSLLLTSDGQVLCLNNEHHPRHILDVLEDAMAQGVITKEQVLAIANTQNKNEEGKEMTQTVEQKNVEKEQLVGRLYGELRNTYGMAEVVELYDNAVKQLKAIGIEPVPVFEKEKNLATRDGKHIGAVLLESICFAIDLNAYRIPFILHPRIVVGQYDGKAVPVSPQRGLTISDPFANTVINVFSDLGFTCALAREYKDSREDFKDRVRILLGKKIVNLEGTAEWKTISAHLQFEEI